MPSDGRHFRLPTTPENPLLLPIHRLPHRRGPVTNLVLGLSYIETQPLVKNQKKA